MTNEEMYNLVQRLGRDARLTHYCEADGSIMFYADFWQAFGEFMKAMGIKTKCPYYREEQEHE